MTGDINVRKREHLEIIHRDVLIERHNNQFDSIQLTHRAFPEINLDEIDTRVEFLGKILSFPLLISSMTGGSDDYIRRINKNLAIGAETCQVAMAVGSQRIMMREKLAHRSFALREFAPSTVLIGNMGAVQLNYGFEATHFQQAVDILEADGIYLHLNPLQEAVQPEGDTQFAGLSTKIAQIVRKIHVPILLKEVGCGLSLADIALGINAGIYCFDIAGRGGTSWSRIEYHRRKENTDDLGLVFQDWGLDTVSALKQAHINYPDIKLIASGGVRTGIDIAKAIILGAQICGVAAPLLSAAEKSAEAVIQSIARLQKQYRTALFLLGCQNTQQLRGQLQYIVQEKI